MTGDDTASSYDDSGTAPTDTAKDTDTGATGYDGFTVLAEIEGDSAWAGYPAVFASDASGMWFWGWNAVQFLDLDRLDYGDPLADVAALPLAAQGSELLISDSSRLYRVDTNDGTKELLASGGYFASAVYAADKIYVADSNDRHVLCIGDDCVQEQIVPESAEEVSMPGDLHVLPGEERVVFADQLNGAVYAIDTASDAVVAEWQVGTEPAHLSGTSDGTVVAAWDWDPVQYYLFDAAASAPPEAGPVSEDWVLAGVALRPGHPGTLLVLERGYMEGELGRIYLRDVTTGETLAPLPLVERPMWARFTPDGARAIVRTEDGTFIVVSVD